MEGDAQVKRQRAMEARVMGWCCVGGWFGCCWRRWGWPQVKLQGEMEARRKARLEDEAKLQVCLCVCLRACVCVLCCVVLCCGVCGVRAV
jgi:hypothetical protein